MWSSCNETLGSVLYTPRWVLQAWLSFDLGNACQAFIVTLAWFHGCTLTRLKRIHCEYNATCSRTARIREEAFGVPGSMMRRISDVAFQRARRALFCSCTPSSSPSEYEAMTMSNLWSPVIQKIVNYSDLSCSVSKLCNNAGKSARIDNHCCTWKVSMSCRTCLQLLSELSLGLTSGCLFDWKGHVFSLHASYHICPVCWATFFTMKGTDAEEIAISNSKKGNRDHTRCLAFRRLAEPSIAAFLVF